MNIHKYIISMITVFCFGSCSSPESRYLNDNNTEIEEEEIVSELFSDTVINANMEYRIKDSNTIKLVGDTIARWYGN